MYCLKEVPKQFVLLTVKYSEGNDDFNYGRLTVSGGSSYRKTYETMYVQ